MDLRQRWLSIALLVMIGAYAGIAQAQVSDLPAAESSDDDEEFRFQIEPHDFSYNGNDFEIYLKLDCHTGQTWRFHASKAEWTPIAEPKDAGPDPSDYYRYKFFAHYYQQRGVEEEMFLRADLESGKTWYYRGVFPGWKELPDGVAPHAIAKE